ncbi:MAG: hypothetical protein U0528_05090 [Anaerolineae bacterium]|nr:hypothetical protein [Anaerolineae bacterium]
MNNMYGTSGLDFMREIGKLTARKQADEQHPRQSLRSLLLRLIASPRKNEMVVTITLPRNTRAKARGYAK